MWTRTEKPWGYYEVLYVHPDRSYLVKRLVVNPGHKISLQMHEHRVEHWVVVEGACAIKKNELQMHMPAFTEYVNVQALETHRIHNNGDVPCVIIEVQKGYCDEADIIRYDDDYGRV